MVDERPRKGTVEYFLFVVHKRLYTLVLEFADDAGTQIDDLFVGVSELFLFDALAQMLLGLLVEESQHELGSLVERHNLQLMGIFEVHDLVADVVSSFYKIHQRMAGVAQGFTRL